MTEVAAIRIQPANRAGIRADGEYVLYWMTAFRRLEWSFALDHAVARARELGKPLLVFEPLRAGYRWASDRIHRFVLDGMAGHARRLERSPVLYYPYVEPRPGEGSGLLAALAARACLVVADDSPAFFLPRMVAAAAARLPVRLERVDSNGLLPIAAAGQTFPTAYAFRRFLHGELPRHLGAMPSARPLAGRPLPRLAALPAEIARRWPPASPELLGGSPREPGALAAIAALPIDHSVPPVAAVPGGAPAARKALARFLDERLGRYGERNDPAAAVTSGLSPYLHFGHLSAHEVLAAVAEREGWTPMRLAADGRGAKQGWWAMGEAAESFLDELVTWRELGYNLAARRPDDYDRFESLPDWARRTLGAHARDERPHLYSLDELAAAATHDELWNAAQGQLLAEGRIHNYLRMLWGKKVLHWSASPEVALADLIELNNRYALDGRDPNSYSGIFWCLGRFDRPWAPERPVFGTVRYMSTESARRKLRVEGYVDRYAPGRQMRLP